jgi:hypothetical protein
VIAEGIVKQPEPAARAFDKICRRSVWIKPSSKPVHVAWHGERVHDVVVAKNISDASRLEGNKPRPDRLVCATAEAFAHSVMADFAKFHAPYRSSDFGPSVTAIQQHFGAVEKQLENIGRVAGRRSVAAPGATEQIGDTISTILGDMMYRFR